MCKPPKNAIVITLLSNFPCYKRGKFILLNEFKRKISFKIFCITLII